MLTYHKQKKQIRSRGRKEKLIAYNFTGCAKQQISIEINQAKLKQYDLLLNTRVALCRFLLAVRIVTLEISFGN